MAAAPTVNDFVQPLFLRATQLRDLEVRFDFAQNNYVIQEDEKEEEKGGKNLWQCVLRVRPRGWKAEGEDAEGGGGSGSRKEDEERLVDPKTITALSRSYSQLDFSREVSVVDSEGWEFSEPVEAHSKVEAMMLARRNWLMAQAFWPKFAEGVATEMLRTERLTQGSRLLEEEGISTEFKGPRDHEPWSFANFRRSFTERAGPAVCGFLNRGKGGRILFGVHDEGGTVEGIGLNHKERDEVKLLWTAVRAQFYPALDPGSAPLRLRNVYRRTPTDGAADRIAALQSPDSGESRERLFVVEISVKSRSRGEVPRVFFWKSDAYIRHESSTLKMKPVSCSMTPLPSCRAPDVRSNRLRLSLVFSGFSRLNQEQLIRAVREQLIHQLSQGH
jgi:Schlafen, AlbA_2